MHVHDGRTFVHVFILNNYNNYLFLYSSSQGVLDVTIPSNDNPGGVFTISTPSPLTLVDVTAPMATITVTRSGGLIVPVVINWEAVYTDSGVHEPIANFVSMPSGRINFLSGQMRPDIDIQLALRPNLVSVII